MFKMMSKTIPRWIHLILGVLKFLYLLGLLFYLIDYSMLGDGRRFAFQGLDEVIESQEITSLTIAALIGLLLEYTCIYVCIFRIKDWSPNVAYLLMHISVVPFYLYYSNFQYLWVLYVGSMITSIFLMYKLVVEESSNEEDEQMDDASLWFIYVISLVSTIKFFCSLDDEKLEVRPVPKNLKTRTTGNPSRDHRSKRNESQKTTSNVIDHTVESNVISPSGCTQGLINQLSTNSLSPGSYQPSALLAYGAPSIYSPRTSYQPFPVQFTVQILPTQPTVQVIQMAAPVQMLPAQSPVQSLPMQQLSVQSLPLDHYPPSVPLEHESPPSYDESKRHFK